MRVTKLIREYVEKVVCEKMPMPAEPTGMTALRKEWDTIIESLEQHAATVAIQFFTAHKGECAPYYCDEDLNDTERIANYLRKKVSVNFGSHTLTYAERVAYDKAKAEVSKARKEAIENILVTLELGGSKADLDAMLANL